MPSDVGTTDSHAKCGPRFAFASEKPQVRDSGAKWSLGDICMAQLLLGRTAVTPVMPTLGLSREIGITDA